MFKNMKIGMRLTFGFGIMILLLAVLGGISLLSFAKLNHDVEYLVRNKFPKTVWANNMNGQIEIIARATRNMLLVSSRQEVEKEMTRIPEAMKILDENYEKLNKTVASENGKRALSRLHEKRIPISGRAKNTWNW